MAQVQLSHLETPYLQFVETMAQALDARDPYTAGHSLRVADYSYTIALGLGLTETDARSVYIAAQLHDIGKIGIPDAALQKKGRLTQEEFALIKLHPQIGRRILERVALFGKYLNVVELHHENTDGSGYPHGLRGSQIPLDARIVRVADAFDAMTSDRSYRGRWTQDLALKEIFACSGKHFDNEVATVFLNLTADGRIHVNENFIPGPVPGEFQHLLALSDALTGPEFATAGLKNN